MKKQKCAQALLLSVMLLNAGVVGANVVGQSGSASSDTDGVVQFKRDDTPVIPVDPEDPTVEVTDPDITVPVERGDLGILARPAKFDFDINEISSANLVGQQSFNHVSGAKQFVSVWDGRLREHNWSLSVRMSTFANAGHVLTGAEISIKDLATSRITGGGTSLAAVATPSNLTAPNQVTITSTGATSVLSTSGLAKEQSSIYWKTSDITLEIPGASLQGVNFNSPYEAVVTWTLTGTPDA
ncbi:MAG: WxL domain-containing protein [Streptococcaceae bacterium]|jgi:hypothetical protein|nr:WxL domain-containing protein [Streptococcaceae bacterium]